MATQICFYFTSRSLGNLIHFDESYVSDGLVKNHQLGSQGPSAGRWTPNILFRAWAWAFQLPALHREWFHIKTSPKNIKKQLVPFHNSPSKISKPTTWPISLEFIHHYQFFVGLWHQKNNVKGWKCSKPTGNQPCLFESRAFAKASATGAGCRENGRHEAGMGAAK